MNKSKILLTQKIYRVISSISIALTGICLIVGCLMIYRFGAGTYSRDAVAEIFSIFAVPICISLILAIVGLVLELFVPYEGKKTANKPDTAFLLSRLYAKKDADTVSDGILAERKKRRVYALVLTTALCVSGLIFLLYACNGSNFDRAEINASMLRAMCLLVPCLTVSFVCGVAVLYQREKSLRYELELVRKLPDAEQKKETPAEKTDKHTPVVRIVLIAAAIILLFVGLYLGGAADVLTKAINICTECIGLG